MKQYAGRRVGGVLTFVILALAVFAALVASRINGSSIGMLYTQQEYASSAPAIDDPDLLLGTPRAIRSDEWSIGTPSAVSQTVQSFPDEPWIGLTETDLTVFPYGVPVLDVITVAKPQSWGYLILGPERGLSWSWWFPFLLAACSLYALFYKITGRPWLSATAATLGFLTPYVAWWTSPSPNLFAGYAALAAYAAVSGFLARSTWGALGFGALAGWAVSASALLLYPPWTVSTGLVVAALVVGVVVDAKPSPRNTLLVVAGAAATAALIVVPWLVRIAPVIEVINSTIYPGQRRSGSGEGVWQALLSGPANLVVSTTGQAPVALNQSEVAASWIPVVVVLLLALIALIKGRPPAGMRQIELGRGTVAALASVFVLLLIWMLISDVPSGLGVITLLNRVPGSRLPLALGLALVLLAVVLSTFELKRLALPVRVAVITLGVIVSVVGATYSAHQLYPSMSRQGLLVTAAGAGLIALAFGLMALGTGLRAIVPLACAYALISFAVVNPVYRGLGPLTQDPVAQYARQTAVEVPGSSAVTLGGRELQALVRGGGMQVQSWTTQYPDRAFWEKVMPGREDVWNNYRNYAWSYDPDASPMDARIVAGDAAELFVDLCDPLIRDLGYSRVFSTQPIAAPCLVEDRVLERGEQRVHVYRTVD